MNQNKLTLEPRDQLSMECRFLSAIINLMPGNLTKKGTTYWSTRLAAQVIIMCKIFITIKLTFYMRKFGRFLSKFSVAHFEREIT